jgi:hypothetical protein
MGSSRSPRPAVIFSLMVGGAALAGPVAYGLGREVDAGHVQFAVFSFVFVAMGYILAAIGNQLEALAYSLRRPPWLGGRLRRWQRLLLPSGTGTLLSRGWGLWSLGVLYLVVAEPGLDALAVMAIVCNVVGTALIWVGMARVISGGIVLWSSGLWRAPRWAWVVGGGLVVVLPVVFAARSLSLIAESSAVI